jgi:hypothetical protein
VILLDLVFLKYQYGRVLFTTLVGNKGSDSKLQTLGSERREVGGKSGCKDPLSLVIPTHGHGHATYGRHGLAARAWTRTCRMDIDMQLGHVHAA